MYLPTPFRVDDEAILLDAIERWPFGLLVDAGTVEGPGATHVPFVVDRPRGCLLTHVAAANPQADRIGAARVLAIFRGPHASVSPHELGDPARTVPTWNYIAVHVRATARRLEGAHATRALDAAVAQHEPTGWHREVLCPDIRRGLERSVTVFALEIETMTGCWKLSQNKTSAMQHRLRAHLLQRGGEAAELAETMPLEGGDHAPTG